MIIHMREELLKLAARISRGKAGFFISNRAEGGSLQQLKIMSLAVGTPTVVKVPGGFICVCGMNKDAIRVLRDTCDEILNEDN